MPEEAGACLRAEGIGGHAKVPAQPGHPADQSLRVGGSGILRLEGWKVYVGFG